MKDKLKGLIAGLIPPAWWLAAKWGWIGLWKIGNSRFTGEDVANYVTNFMSLVHVWWVLTLVYEVALLAGAIWLLVKPWYRQRNDEADTTVAFWTWVATAGWILVRMGWHLTDSNKVTQGYFSDDSYQLITGFGWLVLVVCTVVVIMNLCPDKRIEC